MPFVPNFLPSRNAPLFKNGPWPPGTSFPIQVPGLPPIQLDQTQAGFCGGMSFLTRDIFEAGTPQLQGKDSVLVPAELAKLLQAKTLLAFLPVIGQWLHVTSEVDHGTVFGGKGLYAETIECTPQITAAIDAGVLFPIGVVLSHSTVPVSVFNNHVELVYGYERNGDILKLHVYDCNFGGTSDPTNLDHTYISLDVSSTSPVKPIETNGTPADNMTGRIRGFFPVPYEFHDPAPAYIDDASALQVTKSPPGQMAPGTTVTTEVSLLNTGSTTWTADRYELASEQSLHNRRWGATSHPVSGSVRPQRRGTFSFTTKAPAAVGPATWAWQLARKPDEVFGPQAAKRVLVGAQTAQCQAIRDRLTKIKQELAALKVEKDQLDPRDPHELARIKAILKEMTKLNGTVVDLQHQAAVAGCAL
jgi:hypothetical protein